MPYSLKNSEDVLLQPMEETQPRQYGQRTVETLEALLGNAADGEATARHSGKDRASDGDVECMWLECNLNTWSIKQRIINGDILR